MVFGCVSINYVCAYTAASIQPTSILRSQLRINNALYNTTLYV